MFQTAFSDPTCLQQRILLHKAAQFANLQLRMALSGRLTDLLVNADCRESLFLQTITFLHVNVDLSWDISFNIIC
jgi:hypothetical protein